MQKNTDHIDALADHLFRESSGKMVAALCRIFSLNQIDNVTDIVHDTFETALIKWRFAGVPENPSGWLMQVAKNKAVNFFKRNNKLSLIESSYFPENSGLDDESRLDHFFLPDEVEDSQLRLLLTCCHPALSDKNQIILTLNILSGFGIEEIANALFMKNEAVKKALFRSRNFLKGKCKILQTSLLLQYEKRVKIVHAVVYLMFNEGYKSTKSCSIINHDLCYEAIRLTKLLLLKTVALKSETNALLALMFFDLSRFPARLTAEGEIVGFAFQDRTKWDRKYIAEGNYYLTKATRGEVLSRYHLEAIIASLHCGAENFENTDWVKIGFLYDQLEVLCPSPILKLNIIVAKSYIHGPHQALQELEKLKLENKLTENYTLRAVEGDIFERCGQRKKAIQAYKQAILTTPNVRYQRYFEKRILQIEIATKGNDSTIVP